MARTLGLTCFISGGGRTLLNLLDRIEAGTLDARIDRVIASRPDLAGVERARARGLEPVIAPRGPEGDDVVDRTLDASGSDLAVLCGWLRLVRIAPAWRGRIVNIHPSLLPRHGGRGFHGDRVHAAVLEAGDRFSGCTVHSVDDVYDEGPVILQRSCPVEPGDDVRTLADRVFALECEAYPTALQWIAEGRVHPAGGADAGRVVIDVPVGTPASP